MEEQRNFVEELRDLGNKKGFRVICRQAVDYDWGREISNSRIDRMPLAIVLPRDAGQVACCVKFCTKNEVEFRVRSGGHHHEGMCSLDDGVVIRLSEFNRIEDLDPDDEEDKRNYPNPRDWEERARIGVGKPLDEVYSELQSTRGMTIPGGGCQTVNIGGLTLGGGWGTSVRKMGLTCDNFEEAEVVTAEGEVIRVRADNKYRDLFWALRGGGGGNFGIVTRFLFRLSEIGSLSKFGYHVSTFSLQWKENGRRKIADMVPLVKDYLKLQADFPEELTTAMGLRVRNRFMKEYYPIGIAGKFYGEVGDLWDIMKPFVIKYAPSFAKFEETIFTTKGESDKKRQGASRSLNQSEAPQLSSLINSVVDDIYLGAPFSGLVEGEQASGEEKKYQNKPPAITCSDPWPHKISSGFPKDPANYPAIAEKALGILVETNEKLQENAARLYIVLHGMPGKKSKAKPKDTAFYWRDKEFIVQFQAWWAKPSQPQHQHEWAKKFEKEQDAYLEWIGKSRKALAPELEGAFINFVDKTIGLGAYYGDNFEELKRIKRKYDPDNVFDFPLSIPVANG